MLNNIFFACPKLEYLANPDNRSNGNLFDAGVKGAIFDLEKPAPAVKQSLQEWRQSFGFDMQSVESTMKATLDPKAKLLRFACRHLPEHIAVAQLGPEDQYAGIGPFNAEAVKALRAGQTVEIPLPRH